MSCRRLASLLSLLWIVIATSPAYAYTMNLHEFKILRDSGTYFLDTFDDGLEPPQSPEQSFNCGTNCYFVGGSYPDGSESAGRLELNTAFGTSGANAVGTPVITQRATLSLSTTPSENQGLQAHRMFEVSVLIDLVIPGAGESFSLRLTDRVTGNTMDDFVQIQVANPSGSNPQIRFREQDFVAKVITPIDADPISAASGDQVRLFLSHPTENTNTISASYEFFKSGVSQGTVVMSGSADIYSDEIWTRPEFAVSTAVPEPSTYLLMAVGMLMVGGITRRVRRPASALH
jgi:hypothetical protein